MEQNVQIFTLSGVRDNLYLDVTNPAAEKSRSASDDVAYTAKFRLATIAKIGYRTSFSFHQSSTSSLSSFSSNWYRDTSYSTASTVLVTTTSSSSSLYIPSFLGPLNAYLAFPLLLPSPPGSSPPSPSCPPSIKHNISLPILHISSKTKILSIPPKEGSWTCLGYFLGRPAAFFRTGTYYGDDK